MLLPRVQQVNNIQHENYQHELIKIVLLSLYITFIILVFFNEIVIIIVAALVKWFIMLCYKQVFLLVIFKPPSTSTLLIKARLHNVAF